MFLTVLCSRQNPDKREGRCYMEIEERGGQRRCHQEMGAAVTKATCCCSMGKAWGSRCESCPPVNTEEYKTLCPGGTGYRPNPSTVSIFLGNDSQSFLCECVCVCVRTPFRGREALRVWRLEAMVFVDILHFVF